MDKNIFKERLSVLKEVVSVTGRAKYCDIRVEEPYLYFRREQNAKDEKISLEQLYEFYTSERELTTCNAKDYIDGRAQSPAVAILTRLRECKG